MIYSSESEDDCYGNVVQKLEKLKNKYQHDIIESVNLLNESEEFDKTPSHIEAVSQRIKNKDDEVRDELLASDQSDTSVTDTRPSVSRGRGRGRSRKRNFVQTSNAARNETSPRTSRDRHSRRRNRGRTEPSVAVYSVGDVDEYPDQSKSQALFSATSDTEDVILVKDDDTLEENEELSVKVCWRSTEYCTFAIRRFQKLATIFRHFADKEKVSEDRLLLMYNDKIIGQDDTPDTIGYNIAKFVEGGVVSQAVTKQVDQKQLSTSTGIQIKFQSQNLKKPFEITVQCKEKLSTAMIKCAEQLEQPVNRLRFQFDGYNITGAMTADELELEGGECIDVKVV